MGAREIIEGLECLMTKQKPCAGCTFNPRPGMMWPYGCGKGERDIVKAAQERLSARSEKTETEE